MKLAEETLENIEANMPRPTKRKKQNLCLDKGYDFDEIRELAKLFEFTTHIRSRTYIAMLHFACGIITWRSTGLLDARNLKENKKNRGLFRDFSPVVLSCDAHSVKPQKKFTLC